MLKTLYQRLMEFALTQEEKDRLAVLRSLLNPVQLQHNLNWAIDNLLTVHRVKITFFKRLTRSSRLLFDMAHHRC
jgi:hypothetical protein